MFFWALRVVGFLGIAVNLTILYFVVVDIYDGGGKYGYSGLIFVAVSLVWFSATLKAGSIGLSRLRRKGES